MDIIVCHLNADFDCLSSMLGAKKIYPDAVCVMPGSEERKVREFLHKFQPFQILRASDIDIGSIKRVIVVDTSRASRLGPFEDVVKMPGVSVHLYDHHPSAEDRIRAAVEVVEEVGATATLFVEEIVKKQIPISPLEATVLCLGIYEETGSFRFPTTTFRDLQAAAYLLRKGANLNIVSEYIKIELGREEIRLLNELLSSFQDIYQYGIRVRVVKASRTEYVVDAAGLAHRIMDMEEIDALVMILEMEGKVVIICRSRVPEFDVTELLKYFDGGGHPSAGSATVSGVPLELVEERILQLIPGLIRPQKVVRDIMTSPVITISHNTEIKKAEVLMTRYGVNVLPVLKSGRYFGIITREVVEKAILHGFGMSKVQEFTTTDAETTAPDTPLQEVERTMVEKNQRFMPVIQDGRVVGCITRTDLLRALYDELLRRKRLDEAEVHERPSIGRNVAHLLRERMPPFVFKILEKVGRHADEMTYRAYLVGGSVRDLLMGQKNLDIDIVIEGDAIAFATSFSRTLKGVKLVTHRRFNTAKIIFNKAEHPDAPLEDFTIDIATARTEYYDRPAALPRVETSSIKKDLYRRDFTINTLAIKLNPDEFGLLLDFFGAQRDIKERVIRVLHNLSFVEDPTRAFRAVRFAERFGFKISRHTERLIRSAVRLNLFKKLTGSRLYDELALIFKETDPLQSIQRLSQYGLLETLHPSLKPQKPLKETVQSIRDVLTWFDLLFLDEPVQKETLYLMGLLSIIPPSDRRDIIDRLGVPPRQQRLIGQSLGQYEVLSSRLMTTDDPVEIYRLLHPLPLETVLFVMATSKNKRVERAISRYLLELRTLRPALRGKDLLEMGFTPGPIFSKILEDLLHERLRGNLKTEADERRFVIQRYGEHLRRVPQKIST